MRNLIKRLNDWSNTWNTSQTIFLLVIVLSMGATRLFMSYRLDESREIIRYLMNFQVDGGREMQNIIDSIPIN